MFVFDNLLTVISDDNYNEAQVRIEKESFLISYLLLDDYKSDKVKK